MEDVTGAASANSKDTENAVRVNFVTTPENTSDLASHTERHAQSQPSPDTPCHITTVLLLYPY